MATPAATIGRAIEPDVRRDVRAMLGAPDRRVRAAHPRFDSLIAEGVRRSETFARLVAALNDTDVIVYIAQGRGLPAGVEGRIQLVPIVHFQRYLRIEVRTDLPQDQVIAIIAHELRHALEIGTAPEVRDDAAVKRLYQRIGISADGGHAFDTIAAQRTGRQVQWELRES
jgi:hypothetical protein